MHTVPGALDVGSAPSKMHSLPGAWDVAWGPSRVRTLPGAFHITKGVPCGWVGRRLQRLLQENSPNCPQVFLFEKFCLLNPASPYKEGPVLSHSPPLQLDQGLSWSGSDTAQLSTLPSQHTWSLWVYHFVLIPLPVASSKQVSRCCSKLVWQGRELLTQFSPRSPAASLGLQ